MALMYPNDLDFYCDYCDRAFTRKYNLQTHIENCHNTSCVCDICHHKFSSPAGLHLHLSQGHNSYGLTSPECDICGRIFTRKQNISAHMITVHLQGSPPKIKSCNKTVTRKRKLKRHNLQHNAKVNYPCDVCQQVFENQNTFVTHMKSAHKASSKHITCNLCSKVYSNKRNLKRHIEMFHGEKAAHRCDFCTKVYTSNQSLRRHVRTQHDEDAESNVLNNESDSLNNESNALNNESDSLNNESDSLNNESDDLNHKSEAFNNKNSPLNNDNVFYCGSCNRSFNDVSLLRRHMKQDHSFEIYYQYCKNYLERQNAPKQSYKCEFCFSPFPTAYTLKDHMKAHHDTDYRLHTCNVCFTKFYSEETIAEHKKTCLPPPNVNSCSYCDKLFTDVSSLEFHTRIFHPQSQIADSNVTSTNDADLSYKCKHCDRLYYSERSLKHHNKLKHTAIEAVECEYCGKLCNNKYYLASHIKIVHSDTTWAKCDYCEKQFKSKRNIRRHIEYTHMGMQRYKCIECESLFKEKRSLRKHVRTKHPNSNCFPQCHFCYKRFESAKSCKIHLKLIHSFNMNTYPCDLCSVSFNSKEAIQIHLATKHLVEDEIYKCDECNILFKGPQKFDEHNDTSHAHFVPKQKELPRCIICIKDFSSRKTLRRHIKKFHTEFEVDELANCGSVKRSFVVDCEECVKSFADINNISIYNRLKNSRDAVIFTCGTCNCTYNSFEFAVQRQKVRSDGDKTMMMLSELCTTQMSENEIEESGSGFGSLHTYMEAESTTGDIKLEPEYLDDIKTEPMSP